MERINYSTKSPFEPLRGYSRAVQVGDTLYVSGTTAMNSHGEVIAAGDAYQQARYVIGRLRKILQMTGFTVNDVISTRMFVTNISRWEEFARAHREAFEIVRPASSIVQVSKLVDSRMMLEMELVAHRGLTDVKNIAIEPDSE